MLLHLSAWLAQHVPPALYAHMNMASVTASLYLAYYAVLDVTAAALISPLWALFYYAAHYLAFEKEDGARIALIGFVASWAAQFYGHGVHEGRSPALLDNLLGALVLAPLFVFLEVLFAMGYRPELQHWLKNEVGRQITDFRLQQAEQKRRDMKSA